MTADQPLDEGCFEAYWPRAARISRARPLARRLDTLDGKRIAFLWDYLFRGDEIFQIVEEELKKRFSGVRFLGWREVGNIHSNDERQKLAALPALLQAEGIDAVVVAVAA